MSTKMGMVVLVQFASLKTARGAIVTDGIGPETAIYAITRGWNSRERAGEFAVDRRIVNQARVRTRHLDVVRAGHD